MNVLALEPYYGGSHRAFLDGWRAHSRHAWMLLTLPPHKWKWRMRHAPITFAEQLESTTTGTPPPEILLCTDMLNLAEFLGLAPEPIRRLPRVAYFHENQLTYPARHADERDAHFALTNLTTALAATAVWFNSAFHRDNFLAALAAWLRHMPDYQPLAAVERILAKACVQPPGIDALPPHSVRLSGPLHVLWAARWEHDKDPETFFEAMKLLKARGVPFRLSVIGAQFREAPPIFAAAAELFRAEIDRWGYQPTRTDYVAALQTADVLVSTAAHEFFGLSVVEALAAGCFPLLPRRLAYPELLAELAAPDSADFFYDGGATELANRLEELATRTERRDLWRGDPQRGQRLAARFAWLRRAAEMDAALDTLRLTTPTEPSVTTHKQSPST
jgi:glycosyltransferase involved in cell wall biosynthesis